MPLSSMDVTRLYSADHGVYDMSCDLNKSKDQSVEPTTHSQFFKAVLVFLYEMDNLSYFLACLCSATLRYHVLVVMLCQVQSQDSAPPKLL